MNDIELIQQPAAGLVRRDKTENALSTRNSKKLHRDIVDKILEDFEVPRKGTLHVSIDSMHCLLFTLKIGKFRGYVTICDEEARMLRLFVSPAVSRLNDLVAGSLV